MTSIGSMRHFGGAVVFVVTLSVFGGVIAAQSTPEAGAELPVARTATERKIDAKEPAALRLAIVHATVDELKFTCGPRNLGQCADALHWRIDYSGKRYARDEWEKELLPKLTAEAQKSLEKTAEKNPVSTRAVEITADRGTPWSVVSGLLDLAATARLPRIAFSVKPAAGDPKKPSTLPLPLPVDRGTNDDSSASQPNEPTMVSCSLMFDEKARTTRFSCGTSQGLLNADGEKALEAGFREAVAASKAGGSALPILILRPTPAITWQDVVKVVDAARSAGIATIEMSAPPAASAKPRASERLQRKAKLVRDDATKTELETTEKIVLAGLDWLKRHQEKDGSWDAGRTHERCEKDAAGACKDGSSEFIAGTTALAVVAFHGATYDARRETPYSAAVASGVRWLVDHQDADGCIGERPTHRFTYNQAYSLMALAEAVEADGDPRIESALQRAVDFAIHCQNPGRGWRYGVKPSDNDSSITALMVRGLVMARDAGARVDRGSIRNGLEFLRAMTDDATGRTGYVTKGSPSVRLIDDYDRWPPELSECLTAKALVTRICAREVNRAHKHTEAGFKLLTATLPVWDEQMGTIDYDFWQAGLSAMRQWGGADYDRWRKNLVAIAKEHQLKDGCARGSFPAVDPWSKEGGSIYTTAMMVLAMEVDYRDPVVLE